MNYLIVGPSWVGDMVMAQSLFKALLLEHPSAKISVLAPAATHPLLARMPEVTNAILSPISHGKLDLKAHYQLGKSLRAEFDGAIILPGSLKSSLITFFAKVPIRRGWKGEMRYGLLNDIRHLDRARLPLMVQQFVALASDDPTQQLPYEQPSLTTDSQNIAQLRQRFSLRDDRPCLAFCPGAEFGPAKQWPAKHFISLANKRISEGWQVRIFGGPKDVEFAETIQKQILLPEHCVNLAGKTSLLDAIDLLSLSEVVVTNDSGLMHVSAALGKKLVVLYGSSSSSFTPPLSDSAESLSLNLSCSPCFKRECPLGHLDCLNNLLPMQVDAAIEKLLH